MKCYHCNDELTPDNRSVEHIIPNFLGGHITSTSLLCKKCNNKLGSSIDTELSKQLGFAADLVVQKRDRKKGDKGIEVETMSGKKLKVGSRLAPKPKLTIQIPGKTKSVEIFAENDDDMRRIAAEKESQLQVKFGKFKLTETLEPPPAEKIHFKNALSSKAGEIAFGGVDYFRALGKIMLNFYLAKCKPQKPPTRLMGFVNGTTNANQVFIYHPADPIHNLSKNEFSHIIHIRGEKEIKAVYCYLELFNFENYICILDDNYDGEEFSKTYIYDCIQNKELDKEVRVNVQKHHVEAIKFISFGHRKSREKAFNAFEKRVESLQDI